MERSPVDDLFFQLYGYYPSKAGQSFEMIVAAAFKLLLNKDVDYDQRIRGQHSGTVYQLDGVINNNSNKSMVEAKDYTLDKRKVGRSDIQKLQGALTDLSVNKGVFVSATDYTNPAKKYAASSSANPLHKEIELFHIRPSTEEDEHGRIKKIIVNIIAHVPDYWNGKYTPVWTKKGWAEFEKDGLAGKPINFILENIYKSDRSILTTLTDLTLNHSPETTWEEGFIAKAAWLFDDGNFEINGKLYSVRALEYEIAFHVSHSEIVIEGGGNPKIYIKSENGSVNKLITDQDLKKVKFENGKVVISQ